MAVVIFVGVPAAVIASLFVSVEEVGTIRCAYCAERGQPLVVARGATLPLPEVWPQVRFYL